MQIALEHYIVCHNRLIHRVTDPTLLWSEMFDVRMCNAVDNGVLGGAEAPPNFFWKIISKSSKHAAYAIINHLFNVILH